MVERLKMQNEQWPREVRRPLVAMAERYAWLIPAWCIEVHLRYQNADLQSSTAIARTSVNYEYRAACMTVFSSWFDGNDRQRRKNLAHEFCHIITAPMADYVADLIRQIIPDQMLQAVIHEEHTKRVESVVEDMASMIIQMEDDLGSQIGKANLNQHFRLMKKQADSRIRRGIKVA
ncbi:MAG: hypothetical protein ACLGJB_24825 [Blastocatellia bacterium]